MIKNEKNAEIFKDTEHLYSTNKILKNVVSNSIKKQKLILAYDNKWEDNSNADRQGRVIVSGKRTFEAAEVYARQGKRVCVLNFASATRPGGGVIHGAWAQEEALCRCSTLYPCLNTRYMWNNFYQVHRNADNPLYNDDCIYTPGVKVFKSDIKFPELLPEEEWWDVDIITCAAPNLRQRSGKYMNPYTGSGKADISDEALRSLHTSRIQRIFSIARANGAEVLILGAFGCGAFRNPPEVVSKVFAELTKQNRYYFDVIEYAVFHKEKETENYKAFKEAMEKLEK